MAVFLNQLQIADHVRCLLSLQLFTVFVSSFISGSLLNQIQGIINNPSSILQILGTGVPQVRCSQGHTLSTRWWWWWWLQPAHSADRVTV